MAPGTFWTVSAGAPYTQRNLGACSWGAIEISPPKVRRVLGYEIELPLEYGFADESLARVVRALLSEVRSGGQSGPLFADGLTTAIISRLGRLFGSAANQREQSGAIESRLKRVLERIEDCVGDRLTVASLAEVAGLSPAHFAREFKRCMNETPHAFVMRRRLDRARQMMAAGASLTDVATDCGFADQAHLSRLFKQQFGVTPTAFVRIARR
jgi:AraC family transcriptional regulator